MSDKPDVTVAAVYGYEKGHRAACEEILTALVLAQDALSNKITGGTNYTQRLQFFYQKQGVTVAQSIVSAIRDGKPYTLDGERIV